MDESENLPIQALTDRDQAHSEAYTLADRHTAAEKRINFKIVLTFPRK